MSELRNRRAVSAGLAGAVLFCALVVASPAHGHGFGQRYDLPIPLWLYLTGAGLTVAGHMAAVFLAHLVALQEFPHGRASLRSQYPMLFLMICYTITSLWIISQPILTSRFE